MWVEKSLFAAQEVFDSAVDKHKNPQAAVIQTTMDSHWKVQAERSGQAELHSKVSVPFPIV